MHPLRQTLPVFLSLLGGALFLGAAANLKNMPGRFAVLEMETALPPVVQVVLAGGDRFLAANLATFRALTISSPNLPPENLRIQGMVQADAAWLNPAHEDNYYVAAASLPWGDQLDAADYVLERAANARPFDFVPPFFHGFNQFYFRHDPLAGAKWLRVAAEHSEDEDNRVVFETTAARWIEKGSQPADALRVLEGMKQAARSASLKQQLQQRIDALRALMALQEAARKFGKKFGKLPAELADLVRGGFLSALPENPPGRVFVLDEKGVPALVARNR